MANAASRPEILERFTKVVVQSLRIDPSQVTEDAFLDDLGAESLDLAEITMESEEEFDILIPQKNILQTATEVFGDGVLARDGKLTEEGKRFLLRRMPEFPVNGNEIAVADLSRQFLRVGTWVRMIEGLMALTPRSDVTVKITFKNGAVKEAVTRCRIDTINELDYYRHGGILHYVLRNLVAA